MSELRKVLNDTIALCDFCMKRFRDEVGSDVLDNYRSLIKSARHELDTLEIYKSMSAVVTDEEQIDTKSIWLDAHVLASNEFERIKSGICKQPGLASSLANFAIKRVKQARVDWENSEHDKYSPRGYMVFWKDDDRTRPLVQFTSLTEDDVKYKIMYQAKSEGFEGTIEERLHDLNWVIKPIFVLNSPS